MDNVVKQTKTNLRKQGRLSIRKPRNSVLYGHSSYGNIARTVSKMSKINVVGDDSLRNSSIENSSMKKAKKGVMIKNDEISSNLSDDLNNNLSPPDSGKKKFPPEIEEEEEFKTRRKSHSLKIKRPLPVRRLDTFNNMDNELLNLNILKEEQAPSEFKIKVVEAEKILEEEARASKNNS